MLLWTDQFSKRDFPIKTKGIIYKFFWKSLKNVLSWNFDLLLQYINAIASFSLASFLSIFSCFFQQGDIDDIKSWDWKDFEVFDVWEGKEDRSIPKLDRSLISLSVLGEVFVEINNKVDFGKK